MSNTHHTKVMRDLIVAMRYASTYDIYRNENAVLNELEYVERELRATATSGMSDVERLINRLTDDALRAMSDVTGTTKARLVSEARAKCVVAKILRNSYFSLTNY